MQPRVGISIAVVHLLIVFIYVNSCMQTMKGKFLFEIYKTDIVCLVNFELGTDLSFSEVMCQPIHVLGARFHRFENCISVYMRIRAVAPSTGFLFQQQLMHTVKRAVQMRKLAL